MTGAEFNEAVVRRIVNHCFVSGPPRTWRDLPADVIDLVTDADVREATRRVKATSRKLGERAARAGGRHG